MPRMKKSSLCRRLCLLLLMALLLGALLASNAVLMASNHGPEYGGAAGALQEIDEGLAESLMGTVTIRVQPATSNVIVNQVFDVSVYADAGSSEVYGVEIDMTFDPNYLEVQQITPGTALPTHLLANIGNGTVQFARGTQLGDPPVTGTFLCFTLTIRAKAAVGSTPLTISRTLIGGYQGSEHTGVPQHGTVVVQAASPTPTRTNTPVMTAVPSPTATTGAGGGVSEIVLRQDVDGYTGFEDTYINEWAPDVNYDTNPAVNQALVVRSQNIKKVLLRAELRDVLPPGTNIQQAVLTLYQLSGSHNSFDSSTFNVIRDWNVGQTTWISATQDIVWDTEGCDAIPTDREGAPRSQRQVFPTWAGYLNYPFDFDVTSLVQDWINDPDNNQGMLLLGGEGTLAEFSFGSSQHSTIEVRPRLMIRYYSGPTPTPTATVTGTPPTATPTHTTVSGTPTPTPTPQTSTLTAIQDTFINEWDPTANYGQGHDLLLRANGVKRGMVQFPFGDNIPTGATIYEATLRLYSQDSGKPAIQVSAYGLKQAWLENEATWGNAKTGAAWGSAGASNPASDRDSSPQDTIAIDGNGWFEWSVTDLVRRWAETPATEHGILLIPLAGSSTEYYVSTSENFDGNAPELVVRWMEVPPTPTPTATATITPTEEPVTPTPTSGPGGVVEGVAYVDENENGTPDGGEPRVQNVTIELRSETTAATQTALTGADGSYRFEGLAADSYRVKVSRVPSGYSAEGLLPYVVPVSESSTITINWALSETEMLYLPVVVKNN